MGEASRAIQEATEFREVFLLSARDYRAVESERRAGMPHRGTACTFKQKKKNKKTHCRAYRAALDCKFRHVVCIQQISLSLRRGNRTGRDDDQRPSQSAVFESESMFVHVFHIRALHFMEIISRTECKDELDRRVHHPKASYEFSLATV